MECTNIALMSAISEVCKVLHLAKFLLKENYLFYVMVNHYDALIKFEEKGRFGISD
jgi:hypothetical protein